MSQSPPSDRAEVQARILGFIATRLQVPISAVDPDAPLAELGIQSMDYIEILFALEEEFDLTFTTEQAASLRTGREFVDLVARGLGL